MGIRESKKPVVGPCEEMDRRYDPQSPMSGVPSVARVKSRNRPAARLR